MRVIEGREVMVVQEEVKVLICNCCGEILDLSTIEIPEINSFHQISLTFGARSNNGYDDENWEFDLCEECIINMVKQFKFVPKGFKEDKMESAINSISPGLHQKLFAEWKENGKWNFEYENWFK